LPKLSQPGFFVRSDPSLVSLKPQAPSLTLSIHVPRADGISAGTRLSITLDTSASIGGLSKNNWTCLKGSRSRSSAQKGPKSPIFGAFHTYRRAAAGPNSRFSVRGSSKSPRVVIRALAASAFSLLLPVFSAPCALCGKTMVPLPQKSPSRPRVYGVLLPAVPCPAAPASVLSTLTSALTGVGPTTKRITFGSYTSLLRFALYHCVSVPLQSPSSLLAL